MQYTVYNLLKYFFVSAALSYISTNPTRNLHYYINVSTSQLRPCKLFNLISVSMSASAIWFRDILFLPNYIQHIQVQIQSNWVERLGYLSHTGSQHFSNIFVHTCPVYYITLICHIAHLRSYFSVQPIYVPTFQFSPSTFLIFSLAHLRS